MGILFTLFLILTPCTGIYLWVRSGRKNQKNEAFLKKYDVIINLMSNRRNAKITKLKANLIAVDVVAKKDVHHLSLEELDERLYITWKLESPVFGKGSKEWSFNPAFSQSRMYEEVLTDIKNYQQNMRSEKCRIRFGGFSAA